MKVSRGRWLLGLCLSIAILGTAGLVQAKVPEGYGDIKLGMSKSQVLDLLGKNRTRFSYEDAGAEIREIVRGDDLFRYATYQFNPEGVLVEIGLQMREILGRDKVLEKFNNQYGLSLKPMQSTVEADRSIEVRENMLVMRMVSNTPARSAKRPE